MRFGMWNVRSLCRAGSLITVARERERNNYKLDLAGVHIIWDGVGTEPAGDYYIYLWKGG
jgi:hypothetical protein